MESNHKKIIIGVTAAAVLGLSAVGFFIVNKNPSTSSDSNQTSITSTTSTQFRDGSYSAEGKYLSPGGLEKITVSLTLKANLIETVNVINSPSNRDSERYQQLFIDNFKSKVVGKKISEVTLNKVSGSSLTSAGFNDALGKIKTQAKI